VLTIGEHCYCFRFEETATFKREKKWIAKHAAAPSVCGAPAD
jgi:hypothetical protein